MQGGSSRRRAQRLGTDSILGFLRGSGQMALRGCGVGGGGGF